MSNLLTAEQLDAATCAHIQVLLELGDALGVNERRCRECGCTDHNPCPGGCAWVEDDLCSACVANLTVIPTAVGPVILR